MKILDDLEIEKLWEKLKAKDEFTALHCRRVCELVKKFAGKMNWNDEDTKALTQAALIHDMGKLGIPDEVFDKIRTGETLSNEERQIIKNHAGDTGILEEYSHVHDIIIQALKYHHERYDGSGYPFGLKGDGIPLAVRMLSIADYFDTIVIQRPWKTPEKQEPMGNREGIKILIENSHTRFDPSLTAIFAEIIGKAHEMDK